MTGPKCHDFIVVGTSIGGLYCAKQFVDKKHEQTQAKLLRTYQQKLKKRTITNIIYTYKKTWKPSTRL